ncbi:DUF333 domain-containing protein [Thermodesulfobacteriota bacterium]
MLIVPGVCNAILNPSHAYCTELGYTYEIRTTENGGQYAVCIFPDGSECSTWNFYCTCEPEGNGCWPGEFDCHYLCQELPCKEAGEDVLISECCEGLTQIQPLIIDDDGNCGSMIGAANICTDCGNGICESWENYCSCPQDCHPISKGDINGDGFIDLSDFILSLQISCDFKPLLDVYKDADVNGDGKIGIEEVIFILQDVSELR